MEPRKLRGPVAFAHRCISSNHHRALEPQCLESADCLHCSTKQNGPGSNPEGGCWARRVLEVEWDFRDQKGRLQEEVEYPKFHHELNFVERYWCRAKRFARDNCEYDFEALEAAVPECLHPRFLQFGNMEQKSLSRDKLKW